MAYRPLQGKLAIVTGASRGIGEAIAVNLASKGASLILNYTSPSSEETTTRLSHTLHSQYDINTLIVQADMGDPKGPAHLIATAKNHFAHPKSGKFVIDIIVNNAGVARNDKLADVQVEDFEITYRINVLGPLLLMQAALPYLPTDRSGRIVNLSSISSTAGFLGQSVYGGSKAALEAMTRTWARELAERCTVNAINPGPVKTEMWFRNTDEFMKGIKPMIQASPLMKIRPELDDADVVANEEQAGGRPAYTAEIAGIVGMLCTEDAGWCTGQVVSANGGMRFGLS